MNLKDIIRDTCVVLELDSLVSGLDAENISTDTQNGVKNFVKYFNVIEKEIASEFLPALKKEKIAKQNQIDFEDLEEDILDVVYIKDDKKRKMFFEIFPTYVQFNGTSSEIVYTYLPEDAILTDDILALVPAQVYVCGILREHFMAEGLLDKAQLYEDKFKNSIASLIEKDKNKISFAKRMPKRKWL